MKVQVDNEFQQVRIKDLNDENNVEMFASPVRRGKEFAAAKLNMQKLIIAPTKINTKFSPKYEQCEK